ncbi:C2 family cysteine protease [Oxynema aestuarii]|uniref:Calpain catalytic domain-containing protein n=1 Tax=Oxynema aestuarii AP17 TaxID=2064643 RepID=A0A6H1TTG0_9CYAN|nr:C2 family cysteine protease [Oxynema aestuarii]QIZ69831.1 hypothetical protein HCG48_03915 [Oxynema aestuarii AP17]
MRFVGGSVAGTDKISIGAYDGQDWGLQFAIITTQKVNQAPVVTAYNQTVNSGSSTSLSFSVTDPDGDQIRYYYFSDNNSSSTSGYFTVNGVKQTSGFYVDPDKLNTVRFVGGSAAGTDPIRIWAYDGQDWGYKDATMTTQQVNRAPVVTAYDRTVNSGSSNSLSFSASDPDGDRISYYYFSDYNTSSTSGYFTLNGVKQTSSFSVAADNLNTVRFVGGSAAGTDEIRIWAYDGQTWGSNDATITTQQANRAPVVTAYDRTVNSGSSNSLSFSASDPDGDRISYYYFSDYNTSSTSGYFTLNGVKQTSSFSVAADNLNTVRFVGGSAAGTDEIRIWAYDGQTWGSNDATITTQQANRAPVVTAYDRTVNSGSSINPGFYVSDPDGDQITRYYFSDYNTSSTSGYFTLNGVKQTSSFFVDADKLNTVRFVGGSATGTDQIRIWAYDGQTWGSNDATITTQKVNRAPVVTAYNQTVRRNQSIQPSFSVTDADGDTMTRYAFFDGNTSSTSGYFTVNGVKQAAGQTFYVNADQLNTVRFVGGSSNSNDYVYTRAYDGSAWSNWKDYLMKTEGGSKPVVSATDQTVKRNQSIQPSFSVTDADGDTMTRYRFFDGDNSSTSGYFTVNGVKKAAHQTFYVDADQLHTVRFVGGSVAGNDRVYVSATDGLDGWSTWQDYLMKTEGGSKPVVSATDQTVKRNQSIQPSFSVTDADGDTMTRYRFFDGDNSSTSGYFTVNGVKKAAHQTFYVDADQLHTVRFVGGSVAGNDRVYVSATDGIDGWSTWQDYLMKTQSGSNPVVTASDQTVNANESMKLSFSVTDADGDTMTRYAFFDGNSSSTSGYFTVNGVKQAAGQTFYVDADKLDTVRFVGGAVAGIDGLHVRTSDGVDGWSEWTKFNVSTKATVINDWFEQNIKDAAIRSLARSRFQDGELDRKDMIDIFINATDSGVVDAYEFADLQTLTSNKDYIKMPDYVQILSTKISHGNPANKSYRGTYLGNLQAGSSGEHLGKLIKKHFLGQDHPLPKGEYSYGSASNVEYRYAEGQLFQNGISYEDIKQGAVGDCYYLASLAAVAQKTPNVIKDMFIDNGIDEDGNRTYTVRFYNNGQVDYVTVDRYLPTNKNNGSLPFAGVGNGHTYKNSNNELWVALAEKAYAQMNEAGWMKRYTTDEGIDLHGLNSYKGIEGGWTNVSVAHINNQSGTRHSISSSTASSVVTAFNFGKLVNFSSLGKEATHGSPVVSSHAYTMVDYNQSTGKFKLFNPWGLDGGTEPGDSAFKPGILEMSWNEIKTYFRYWRVNG